MFVKVSAELVDHSKDPREAMVYFYDANNQLVEVYGALFLTMDWLQMEDYEYELIHRCPKRLWIPSEKFIKEAYGYLVWRANKGG